MKAIDYCSKKKSADESMGRDQLHVMMKIEQSYVVPLIPCRSESNCSQAPLESWRRKICQWAFRVIDHFRLDREVVAIGMNIFDRFLVYHEEPGSSLLSVCTCPCCKRSGNSTTYQLAAMTSVFIAAKLASVQNSQSDRTSRTHFRLSTFADLSRGQFSMEDIRNMELTIYQTIGWKVAFPSPITFVSYLLTLMPHHEQLPFAPKPNYDLVLHVLHELSRYLTEIATCLGSSCSHHLPSHVAFAAILVSMDLMTYQALPLTIRDMFRRRVYHICGFGSVSSLTCQLERALWPEMLHDDVDDMSADSGHPITVARIHGLLDLNRIYHTQQHPLGASALVPYPVDTAKSDSIEHKTSHPEISPVSTAR